MSRFNHLRRTFFPSIVAVLLVPLFCLWSDSGNRTYSPKNDEEVRIVVLLLTSEISANNWTAKDLLCFSVNSLDPDRKFVRSVRTHGLNVCSSAEWRKKFNCGFEVELSYTHLDLSGDVRIRSRVVDLQDINTAKGDLATLLSDGEYTVKKTDGNWSVGGFVDMFPRPK